MRCCVVSVACVVLFAWCQVSDGGKYGTDSLGSTFFLINMQVDKYILPFLNYSTVLLEPYISAENMELHYYGHHDAYRTKLNAVRADYREKERGEVRDEEEPVSDLAHESILYQLLHLSDIPETFRQQIKNQGGGFVNHALYFGILSPNLDGDKREPTGYLENQIQKRFGTFEEFQELFEGYAQRLFGSGYVWLVRKAGKDGGLYILTTANQDSPLTENGDYPIVCLDVWEHAYYPQHTFKRMDYVKKWWNVVDWEKVTALDKFWNNIQFPEDVPKDEL